MAFRTSGLFEIASSTVPQPMFGSWVTAVSPVNGFANPSGAPLTLTLGTAQSSGNDALQIFAPGEEAWLVDPSNTNAGGVHGEAAIGTGSYIIPKQMLNNYLIDLEDGATGPFLYLGNKQGMTATLWRYYKLGIVASDVQPYFYDTSMTSAGNPFDLSELYVLGTAEDLYCVSINVA